MHQGLLTSPDCEGTLLSDSARNGVHTLEHRLLVSEHLVDEADRVRTRRWHPSPGVDELARDALGYEPWEALQGAEVGGDPDICFLHDKECVSSRITQVT